LDFRRVLSVVTGRTLRGEYIQKEVWARENFGAWRHIAVELFLLTAYLHGLAILDP
jgi:hypothetical protein